MFKNLIKSLSLLSPLLLTACGGETDAGRAEISQADEMTPSMSITIPDRIRTSQVVNLDATEATVSSSAGPIEMVRNGDQFTGSITVEPGSEFTFAIEISENVNGDDITYAIATGNSDQPVTNDVVFTIFLNQYTFPDDDGDGFSNLLEREEGSNHADTFSTPLDPDGQPPTESTPGLLEFASSNFSVAEADGGLTISVTRSGGNDGQVAVNYQVSSETAIVGTDFNAASGQLVFADGNSTPQSFFVTVLTDDENDGVQTFTASLFNPTGGASIGNGFARITLNDSTPAAQRGTIQLVNNSITVDENIGTVQITAERVNGSDGLVTVDFITIAGTATAADFGAVTEPGTLTWQDGESGLRTINIPLTNDAEVEPSETFTVSLSNNIGGATLGLAATSVIIADTTPAPIPEPTPEPTPPTPEPTPPTPEPGQIELVQGTFVVAEGGSIDLSVERQNGSDGIATVDFSVAGGTADDNDFSASDGTLTWLAGDNDPQTITINANTDALLEPDETVIVTLQNAVGAALSASSATVTISDATVPTPGVLAFTSTAVSIDEGSSADVTVARTGGADGAVSVDLTAAASTEYTISPATLTWADGESTNMTVTIAAASDDVLDDTESFNLQLTTATGATLGADTVIVTIEDTTVVPAAGPVFAAIPTDGQWEVCVPPFNAPGSGAFATQLSANEGRIVSCIKTCDDTIELDGTFPGFGFNVAAGHSCTTARNVPGTYTGVPIYTPNRTALNLDIDSADLSRGNSIWACVAESRTNANFDFVADQTNTIWYQFSDDATYLYGSTQDSAQPAQLLGPDVWSTNGRILELGHINTGYRNTQLLPGNQTLHIYTTTDDRLNCGRETRSPLAPVPLVGSQ